MMLVAGLGNPGLSYANTRHNVGFMLIDAFLKEFVCEILNIKKTLGILHKCADTLLLKPQTFMNLSGKSVSATCKVFNISSLVVVHDDVDLKLGVVKYKLGGSSGGHNGLKSIDELIGKEYIRVRIGIDRQDGVDTANYVLQNFSTDEKQVINASIKTAIQGIKALKTNDLSYVQSHFSLSDTKNLRVKI